jgi:hypothetical protein
MTLELIISDKPYSIPLTVDELSVVALYQVELTIPLAHISAQYAEEDLILEIHKEAQRTYVTLYLGKDCNNILIRCIDCDLSICMGKFVYRCMSPRVQKHIVDMIRHEPNQGTWCYGENITLNDCEEMLQIELQILDK